MAGRVGGQLAVKAPADWPQIPALAGLDLEALAASRQAQDAQVPRPDREAAYIRAAVISQCVYVLTGVDLTDLLAADSSGGAR